MRWIKLSTDSTHTPVVEPVISIAPIFVIFLPLPSLSILCSPTPHVGNSWFKLFNNCTKRNTLSCSLSQRTITECNKLSADCVHSSSINMFKNRIDNYLVRARYT